MIGTGTTRKRLSAEHRRAQIVNVATTLIGENGYYRFSLTELANACGITRPGVTHHVGSKEQLLLEVLALRDEHGFAAMRAALGDDPSDLRRALDAQVRINLAQPELVRLYTVLATEAMDREHPARSYFQERWDSSIAQMIEVLGPDDPRSPDVAARIYSFLDGLQLNWLRDPTIDMWAHWTRFAAVNIPRNHAS